MTNDSLSKTAISGTATQVSTVEMLSYRRTCADYFVDVEMPRRGFAVIDMQSIRLHLESHAIYRSTVTSLQDHEQPNTAWMAPLQPASMLCLRLLYDMSF